MSFSWIIQPPAFLRGLFFGSLWRVKTDQKVVFLTFDDGPVPEQTPWVMDTLEANGIRGNFFCVGDNVRKHPDIFDDLVRRGHLVGNHSFNHVQLFRMPWSSYARNVLMGNEVMQGRARFFRPPHGQMLPWRCWQLVHRMGFCRVVFWDVMPKDYDNRLSPQQVLDNVLRHVRPGSVIVFHDSIKAGPRMRFALQGTISHLSQQGYRFALLSEFVS